MRLDLVEVRVLGALMEKEISTPEYYPLSLNALTAACNQKSSRDPVMTLSEDAVRGALRTLEDAELVSIDHGSRVQRYEHRARTVFALRRDETAVLCLLLLRGPQTAGELRGRSDRLFAFEDIAQVQTTLQRMAAPTEQRAEPLVAGRSRQPGSKEARYAHLLGPEVEGGAGGEDEAGLAGNPAVVRGAVSEAGAGVVTELAELTQRVSRLEAEVLRLAALLESDSR